MLLHICRRTFTICVVMRVCCAIFVFYHRVVPCSDILIFFIFLLYHAFVLLEHCVVSCLVSLLSHVGVLLHLCCNDVMLCYICVATLFFGFIIGLYHALTFLFFYLCVVTCICFVRTLCSIMLVFFVVLPLYCNVFLFPCVVS